MARSTGRMRKDSERGSDAGAAERRKQILTEAGKLFAARGFEGASMREIAAATGLLSGSLYYHFASKEELFVAVYDANIRMVSEAVRRAIEGVEGAWARLEAAAIAHCETLLTGDRTAVLDVKFPPSLLGVRPRLIQSRDEHDRLFDSLIEPLELPDDINRNLFRLHVLGALNSAVIWYRPSSHMSPADVARHVIGVLRYVRKGNTPAT
ncbi:TetR family transcriptional regulator [Camelimonas fluminis]|uniref:TetR/AcrR family transcriptional regulator n=1 Tax=Camelimonas fluminis TaxID=1576911 RepID=A0ABV7UDG3_9HYPH|nr:TetR/AcrR family transcriptional regulator [Camelimonas fluminis]GHE46205.1 TetR family transcriptional regulator [Camelimonas fluminis]